MREMLFRAKRLGNGEWVEGNLFMPDKVSRMEVPTEILMGTNIIRISYKVDPSTVGQYTGLQDKSGKRIFEEDIIKTSKYGKEDGLGHNSPGPERFCVKFFDGGYHLANKWRQFNLRPDADMEVIGNIHDNPKLLEGGQDEGFCRKMARKEATP